VHRASVVYLGGARAKENFQRRIGRHRSEIASRGGGGSQLSMRWGRHGKGVEKGKELLSREAGRGKREIRDRDKI